MFLVPAPERLSIAGLDIALLRIGSGRQLLYLHGGDGVDTSDPFIGLLARHFEVIAPIHPGFGDSSLPSNYTSVGDLAYFYLDLMRALGLRDVVLTGSSFGGWIASEIAVRSTAAIGALVLAAPMGACFAQADAPVITDLFSTPIADLPALMFSDCETGMQAFGQLRFADMPDEAVARFARNREALARFGWSPVLSNPDLARWLHRIDVPTLMLWGDDDRVVPATFLDLYTSALPNLKSQRIANAGHYAHIEQPQAFVDAIVAFAGQR